MSQSFPVSCFQLCGSVPHQKWYFTSLACQNTEKKNQRRKIVFGICLSGHCVDSNKQVKKIPFLNLNLFLSAHKFPSKLSATQGENP